MLRSAAACHRQTPEQEVLMRKHNVKTNSPEVGCGDSLHWPWTSQPPHNAQTNRLFKG